MDIDIIWDNFLNKIKEVVGEISYETWFSNTKLFELNNSTAKVLVPMAVHKKILKKNYEEDIIQIFNDVTGSNFKFEYLTSEEIDNNITIDEDQIGVPKVNVFESNLDKKYTFENFILGESNKFAKTIALSVAESPGDMYNPLFIFSNSGLGKTHLMHAIGNYITNNSNKKVLYVTSEKFVNDFLKIYQKDKDEKNFDVVDNFKKKYRDIDVLMIDDIQYLEIANRTQQEFFNTFNDLHCNNKQIIISSDRSPDDLKKLEERLRTRFTWGMTVNISPPDFNLRMAIIDKKIEANNINNAFPLDVKEYIANNCTSDIRKLEGTITRVVAYATIMNGSDITLDLAVEALKDIFSSSLIAKNKIEQVQNMIANNYRISVDDLKSKRRTSNISLPRQIAMYICREYIGESLPKIGTAFGGKDHTTVIHSVEKIKKEIKNNKDLEIEIKKIIEQIN